MPLSKPKVFLGQPHYGPIEPGAADGFSEYPADGEVFLEKRR